ncbi:hypothetical protein SMICM304S_01618 [Streptomyces microflavus]
MNCSMPYGTSPPGNPCWTRWRPPGVLERLRDGGTAKGDDKLSGLTEQERKILDLIGEGLTNRVIGERLHLAEQTIKNYVSSLLSKLGMERRWQAPGVAARPSAADLRRA